MNVIECLRSAMCRAFSLRSITIKKLQTRIGGELLMLAVVWIVCAPQIAQAQTFGYIGSALTPDAANDPNCPVINNITGFAIAGPRGPEVRVMKWFMTRDEVFRAELSVRQWKEERAKISVVHL